MRIFVYVRRVYVWTYVVQYVCMHACMCWWLFDWRNYITWIVHKCRQIGKNNIIYLKAKRCGKMFWLVQAHWLDTYDVRWWKPNLTGQQLLATHVAGFEAKGVSVRRDKQNSRPGSVQYHANILCSTSENPFLFPITCLQALDTARPQHPNPVGVDQTVDPWNLQM